MTFRLKIILSQSKFAHERLCGYALYHTYLSRNGVYDFRGGVDDDADDGDAARLVRNAHSADNVSAEFREDIVYIGALCSVAYDERNDGETI